MVQLPHTLSPDTTWALQVQRLQIRKGRALILTDFTWQHRPGEVAWVVGENGAGKSSLLRILAGHERPVAGSVRRAGPPGEPTGLIYYHPGMALPAQITVRDWARFTESVVPAAIRYPLDSALLPATILPQKRVEQLSTGEAKRLALAALLSRDAPFIILDEPFEHLSREGKELLAVHLGERARTRVVVVATNQEVPAGAVGQALRYDGNRLKSTTGEEVLS